ncbi:MAG: hypothetical protein KC621_31575 [Myxococcales bacterium]|nr:hypothetical protein [Myxococcales bacterium]
MSVELSLDRTDFEPGEVVTGTARAQGRGRVVVSLLWYTAGRGTEDVGIVARQEGEVDGQASLPFELRLPLEPWSFSGTLVSVSWAVEVSIEPNGGVTRQDIVSAPGRQPRSP